MPRRTDLKIPYGVADFKTIRNEGLYYVDKTMFLAKLEERDRFVFFVRPRRFGKSLFVSMMRAYCDRLIEPANFRSLFHCYGVLSMAERREGLTYFRIPNACVEQQLFNYLRDSYRRTKLPDWIGWSKLASGMAYRGEWEPFLRRLAEDFANTTSSSSSTRSRTRRPSRPAASVFAPVPVSL